MAAVSLCFPLNFLMIALGGGLPIAGSVLIAQYKGRGDESAMNHVAGQTLIMVLVVSILLSSVGYALSGPIMRFMGAEPAVLPDAVRFLQITFLGFIFVFGFFVYQSLMRGLGVVGVPMMIVLVTVLLNLVLDPLFIFGFGPVPAMGVSGAALATLMTQALATAIGFTLLFRGSHGLRMGWRDFRPDFPFIWQAFRLGMPASIEQSTRALNLTVMMLLVSSFGTIAVAAYGIGIRILTFVIIPAMGLAMATETLVGQNIGAGRLPRAERTTLVASLIAFFLLLAAGAVMFWFARPLAALFVPYSPPVITECALFIRIMAFTFGGIGLQRVITGTLRGAGNTMSAMLLTLVSTWVIQFPLAYILLRAHLAGRPRHLVGPSDLDRHLRDHLRDLVPGRRLGNEPGCWKQWRPSNARRSSNKSPRRPASTRGLPRRAGHLVPWPTDLRHQPAVRGGGHATAITIWQ